MLPPGFPQISLLLLRRLGVWGTIRLAHTLQRLERQGQPFQDLPPPDCDEERLSRQQIGPAILLYRLLCERFPQDKALSITRDAVIFGAIAFLRKSVGPLRQADLQALDASEREAWVKERGKKFFNATVRWDEIQADRVTFTVTACRFPRLCHEVGHPEMAPLFCEGDATFFGSVEPNVRLERPTMIAHGAETCLFRLRWQEKNSRKAATSE